MLETARFGVSGNLTVICESDGGLRLIMREDSCLPAPAPPSGGPNSSTYHMVRKGNRVFVIGRQGNETCALDAPVSLPPIALLLSNQALYQVESPTQFV